jgi:hypothetical protein
MNLLQETIEDIQQSGHTPAGIIFIGSEVSGHSCTWDEFTVLANKEYDSGFGAQEVANDLIIVFSDGAKMWRHGYDGSEWWSYSSPFVMPSEMKPIKRLFTRKVGWDSLATCNDDVE